MADLAAIQAAIEKGALDRLAADLVRLRSSVVGALDDFGADTGARKRDLVEELLTGSTAEEVALALPWALSTREGQVLERLESVLGALRSP